MSKKHKRNKSTNKPAAPLPEKAQPEEPVVQSTPPVNIKLIAALLIAAVVLRFLYLGRADLWQDEMLMIMTADPAQSMFKVFQTYWEKTIVSLAWLPLPAMTMNVWMSMFSSAFENMAQSGLWARIPGVLFGSAGVWGMYLFARRIFHPWVALSSTLIMACTFYPVFYARELHAYPLLLSLAPFVLNAFFDCLFSPSPRGRQYATLTVLSILLAYTHLTAPMLLGAMAAISGFVWLMRLKGQAEKRVVKQALKTAVSVGIALLMIMPVFIKILTQESPHLEEGSKLTIFFMIHDFVAKLFLGDHLVPSVLAWLIVAAGLAGLLAGKEKRTLIRTGLAIFFLATVLILMASSKSQYLSARYFAVLSPFLIVVFAEGFHAAASVLARLLRRPEKAHAIASVFVGAFVLIHLVVFLPPMYQLKNKSVDFGSIAGWLNENLEPGTPYVMESAYELRYVSGYYPTPNLVPAVPYVHGSRPNDLSILHDRQKEFMLRFPEAVFVQSAHHGYGEVQGMWPYPEEHFSERVDLKDDALRSLVQMGIYPTHFRSDFNDMSFTTQIYYNSPEDARAKARERGDATFMTYPGWRAAQVAQFTYMRAMPAAQGSIVIDNLQDQPIKGRFIIKGAFQGDGSSASLQTALRWGDQVLGPFNVSGQSVHVIETEEVELSSGSTEVIWAAIPQHQNKVQALFIQDAQFLKSE